MSHQVQVQFRFTTGERKKEGLCERQAANRSRTGFSNAQTPPQTPHPWPALIGFYYVSPSSRSHLTMLCDSPFLLTKFQLFNMPWWSRYGSHPPPSASALNNGELHCSHSNAWIIPPKEVARCTCVAAWTLRNSLFISFGGIPKSRIFTFHMFGYPHHSRQTHMESATHPHMTTPCKLS